MTRFLSHLYQASESKQDPPEINESLQKQCVGGQIWYPEPVVSVGPSEIPLPDVDEKGQSITNTLSSQIYAESVEDSDSTETRCFPVGIHCSSSSSK